MDIEALKQYAMMAAALLVTVGPVSAALMQIIKQVYAAVTHGGTFSSDLQAILPALISGGMVAWSLVSAGAPWWMAAMATLVALYVPKAVYDTAKAAHNAAAITSTTEAPK